MGQPLWTVAVRVPSEMISTAPVMAMVVANFGQGPPPRRLSGTDEAVDTEVLAALMVGQAGDFAALPRITERGSSAPAGQPQAQGSLGAKDHPPAPTGSKIGARRCCCRLSGQDHVSKVH